MPAALRPFEEGNRHLPSECDECSSPLVRCPACGINRNCVFCHVCANCDAGRAPKSYDRMRRALDVRQRLDRRCDALMIAGDDAEFWRVFNLYKRACRLELRLIEQRVRAGRVLTFTPTSNAVDPHRRDIAGV